MLLCELLSSQTVVQEVDKMAQSSDGPTWASLAEKGSLQRLNKNVIEIVLEKDSRGAFSASDNETSRVLQKLGMDIQTHAEMVQICPLGRNIIQVTLKQDVDMSRFYNKEVFEVKPGMRVSQVRSAGQREVTLLIKGLHPQTSDAMVIKYLKCMAKVEKTKVILDTYSEGPLKGLQNGDRRYTVEFLPNIPIGAFHIIDGHRVTFSYPGQKRTCYRCLKVAQECLGNGIGKECEASGGEKKLLMSHMQEFWQRINYIPDIMPSSIDSADNLENIEQQIGGAFTPKRQPVVGGPVSKCSSISVKWFPKKADHGDIMKFLVEYGLPEDHDGVNIKENGQVIIENLDSNICNQMINSINGNKFQNKKNIYCQGIVQVTPEKTVTSLPPDKVAKVQEQPKTSSSSGRQSRLLSGGKQLGAEKADDRFCDFEFSEVNGSKFFKKATHSSETESDFDDQCDNLEYKAEMFVNEKKRKQFDTNLVNNKKANRKTTPKSKKK